MWTVSRSAPDCGSHSFVVGVEGLKSRGQMADQDENSWVGHQCRVGDTVKGFERFAHIGGNCNLGHDWRQDVGWIDLGSDTARSWGDLMRADMQQEELRRNNHRCSSHAHCSYSRNCFGSRQLSISNPSAGLSLELPMSHGDLLRNP